MALSEGKVDGERLRCMYHGLEFDRDGNCVKVPGQDRIPKACAVQSFPIVEQDSLVWIWMGEREKANPADVVHYPWHSDPQWRWKSASYHLECSYELLQDNLLDLSHLGFVHVSTIGGDPESHSNAEMHTVRDGNKVSIVRWMKNVMPPPTFVKGARLNGRIDRWQEIEFRPGFINIWAGGLPVEADARNNPRIGGYQSRIFDGITPETESSCHYFWSAAHSYRIDEPEVTELHFEHIATAFEEDRHVLALQQKRLAATPSRGLVDIKSDIASLHARRIMLELIEKEQLEQAEQVKAGSRSTVRLGVEQ
jgi:vanillate O-demethylase monooxygenase subunit